MRSVRGGLREASRHLEATRAEWERVAAGSELPDVHGEDPIADLAIRLDREADFWRGFAMRALRPGAARSIAILASLVGLSGGVGLAALAGLRGLLGADATAAHLWAGGGVLALSVALALVAAAWLERTSARAASDALGRADAAERRLQRIAAILALRSADEGAFRDALTRLERG